MSLRRAITAAAVLVASLQASKAVAATLPPGFQETIVFSGLTSPTAVRFSPDGRVFVAEKSGLIKVFESLSSPAPLIFADLRTEVDNYWDRGLLGLELHPNFPTTPYVYVLYSYDAPIGGTAPTWNDGCPTPPGPTSNGCVVSGRLSRLTASGNAMTGTELVLLEAWGQQFPSHSIGDIRFGPDGALYISGGEGANFNNIDYGQFGLPKNPLGDPPVPVGGNQTPPSAEGGALRAQSLLRASGGPVLASGTILRVNAASGAPLPDNPLYGSSDPMARRIVAYGLRNPFRFAVQPDSGSLWIGDSGWALWEEINRVPDPLDPNVVNFGWPCFEGAPVQSIYQAANLAICTNLYGTPGAVSPPAYAYRHGQKVVPGESCSGNSSSISGLAFYAGGAYPESYRGALFFADYSRRCAWAMLPDTPGGEPNPANLQTFIAGAARPVDLEIGPGGDLYYVGHDGGTVRRIQYHAPTAVASANPTAGMAPLAVAFDGSSSQPAQSGDTITFAWDLDGDGAFDDSTAAEPDFVYNSPGVFNARLRVTDNHGVSTVADPITITVNGEPPVATIDTPAPTLTWRVGDAISFSGHAVDDLDGPLPASALSWTVIIQHCPGTCHSHTLETFEGVAGGSFSAPDHDFPSFLELQLTATDSQGLTNTRTVSLNPRTVSLTFQTSPTGLVLAAGTGSGTTPFARTVIVGSILSLNAPPTQTLAGTPYGFASWSDGGAANHTVVAGPSPVTYVATYTEAAPQVSGLTPASGLPWSTPAIAIEGLNFQAGASVFFGAAAASGVTVAGPSRIDAVAPPLPPAGLYDVSVHNAGGLSGTLAGAYFSDFSDVAQSYLFHGAIETLFRSAITSGCGGGNYCPATPVNRAEMAVFLLRGMHGALYQPPAATGDVFDDVPLGTFFGNWIEQLEAEQITTGCGGDNYCPNASVNRASMAVFLLRAKHGASYQPPAATGTVFDDVPLGTFLGNWIEQLEAEGITTGCGTKLYCPNAAVTRGEMAVFLSRTFELP